MIQITKEQEPLYQEVILKLSSSKKYKRKWDKLPNKPEFTIIHLTYSRVLSKRMNSPLSNYKKWLEIAPSLYLLGERKFRIIIVSWRKTKMLLLRNSFKLIISWLKVQKICKEKSKCSQTKLTKSTKFWGKVLRDWQRSKNDRLYI
jgi:hypothetical protein